jgi:hypothetical protein
LPSRCEPNLGAHAIPGGGAPPRKACGPLAQLLRERPDPPDPRIVVCRGGLTIDARGALWHQDCPSPDKARPARDADAKEMLV